MRADEAIQVDITDGRMRAALCIAPGVDPAEMSLDICLPFINTAGVTINPKVREELTAAIDKYKAAPDKGLEHVIATGTPAVHGEDGYLEWCEGFDPTVEPSASEDVEGGEAVDFYSTSHFVTANVDDHIATVHEPTAGEDGSTVDGSVITANEGRPYKFRTDDSVIIDGQNRVVVRQAGLVSFDNDYLRVLEQLHIDDYVDFSTGHINFDGDVVIEKGIRDCFEVRCTGALEVRGLIEAATIDAGGDAQFMRGMAAREKGTITIGQTLNARYLDNVLGTVGIDLVIEKEVINSELQVGRHLNIEHGAMIGGEVYVGGEAKLDQVGSDGAVATTLCVGEIPALNAAYAKIRQLLPATQREAAMVEEAHNTLVANAGRLNASQREQSTELQFRMMTLQGHVQSLEQKREELLAKIKNYPAARLEVGKRVCLNTVIGMCGRRFRIHTDIKGPVVFHFDDQKQPVVTDALSKSSRYLTEFSDTLPSIDDDDPPASSSDAPEPSKAA